MTQTRGRVGVYGADGFIGAHLVRALSARGALVRAVGRGRHAATEPLPGVERVVADLNDAEAVAASLRDVETVVHLVSGTTPGSGADITIEVELNVLPHVRFFEQCAQAGVFRIVFASSGGTVYGPDAPTPTPETAPTRPISSHGLTKLYIEQFLGMLSAMGGPGHVILRIANPYGPGQRFRLGQGLVPRILESQRTGEPLKVFGQGLQRRDYVFIDDVVDAFMSAIELPPDTCEVLNIGSGHSHSVMDVVGAIELASRRAVPMEFVPARASDVAVSCLDIARAQQRLGWRPAWTLQDGLAKTLQATEQAPGT